MHRAGCPLSLWCGSSTPQHLLREAVACLQVPFAPFEGGPVVEDSQPVLQWTGKHAFRWGCCDDCACCAQLAPHASAAACTTADS